MSLIIERAARVAVQAHAGQKRKNDGSPYIVHPFMVSVYVLQAGYEETVAAAALVHDVLEDSDFTESELRSELGDHVVDIIIPLSEDKTLEWGERKTRYIKNVEEASEETKAVSIADKIHNLENLTVTYAQKGESVWDTFNKGKDDQLWFFRELALMYQRSFDSLLIGRYSSLLQRLETHS